VAPVPVLKPGAWTLLMVGLDLMGFAARRRAGVA